MFWNAVVPVVNLSDEWIEMVYVFVFVCSEKC